MVRRVCFLCSANYYRSRFAEQLFNHLACEKGLDWRAESRGLLVGFWGEIGAISHFTVDALRRRAIPLDAHQRPPQALTAADLRQADLVVAVKESEHRPLMEAQFPDWSERVEYWDVDDLDCAGPEQALPYLENCVRRLVARLRRAADTCQAAQHQTRPGTSPSQALRCARSPARRCPSRSTPSCPTTCRHRRPVTGAHQRTER